MAVCLRELFHNTHLHARKDANGVEYPKSVRGIVLAQRSLPRAQVEEFATAATALVPYLQKLQKRERTSTVKLIELSVFDSGPGLASRQCRPRVR